ncbi:MAG: hypothetical protein IKG25_01405 [Mogibacterium sp.]|nr:hypothetical protein [Mogibacterium sp.]
MAKYVLNLIQACNGAILKVTDGLPDNDHYCIIKEGDPETSGEDSPFVSLVGRYFNDFIIEEAWDDGDGADDAMREFEVTVDIKRIK